jgi:hypothetical protein
MPWPSPAQTGLRRHVNSLRMNMERSSGDQRHNLFASPLNITPGHFVKTEAGPTVPLSVRPWSTSPLQREGSVLKGGVPCILTVATAKHDDVQQISKETGEQKSDSDLPEKTE